LLFLRRQGENAEDNGRMYLGFGSSEEESPDADVAIGKKVCEALRKYGLGVEWHGSAGKRILVYGPGIQIPPKFTCSFCQVEVEGKPEYAIHRDGFCEGPEVPLCKACGSEETPTTGMIWKVIAARRARSK
jgi:hypothetical protein